MKLYFHILKAHIGPFLFAFITLMFIFLLQFLMRAVNQLVGKGLSAWIIGELIMVSLSSMVVLAIPMAVLVATLMAFGKLSSQNEITAMKASGMSLYRMMATVVFASLILTYLLIEFDNNILPEANHRFKVLMIDIRRTKPTLSIIAGMFSQDLPGYSILAHKTFEQSNDLEGVTIYDYTDPNTNVVVTGERGKVSFTPDYRKLIMDLYDGEIHRVDVRDRRTYRRMRYVRHRIVMNAEGFDFERSSLNAFDRSDREMSATEMKIMVDSLRKMNANLFEETLISTPTQAAMIPDPRAFIQQRDTSASSQLRINTIALTKARTSLGNINRQIQLIEYSDRRIDEYLVEINKKYSIPAACLVFVFIGAPLGIIARRGTFGIAATFSLWMANIVLFLLGVYLTIRMGRETPAINWSLLRSFVPKSFRTPEVPTIE
jgi:lipopolysaccharide export system permease protein